MFEIDLLDHQQNGNAGLGSISTQGEFFIVLFQRTETQSLERTNNKGSTIELGIE